MADDTAVHVHVLRVRDHRIRCADPVMVAGGFGHDAVALDLDADWAGLSCVVTLGEGDGAWTAEVGADPVEVPASAIAEPGWLPVSVTGYGDDGAVRATTEACAHLLRVAESGYVPSASDVPEAPDLIGQLLAAGQKATDAADAANDAAKAARDAVARVDEAVSDLGDAAANAAAARESAEAAAKSASDAKASESSAAASESKASTAAQSAADSAAAAAGSAKSADDSATEAASSATGAGQSATEAKASADSASRSASSASDDARTASQSASTAASAASSANDAAAGAQSSAGAAQTAATSAQEDASTAQAAAGTATTQAQAASASASAAAQSAADAKASADTAAGWVPADGEPGQLLSKTDSGAAWVDPPSGNVLTGEATGYVAHAEDAYAQKPIEVRVKGRTVKNLWPVINGSASGVTASTDDTGLITLSGTATEMAYVVAYDVAGLIVGKTYSVFASNGDHNGLDYNVYLECESPTGDQYAFSSSSSSSSSVTVKDDVTQFNCAVFVSAGATVNASFRVMLVEGAEAPDCFTPPASITSVQAGNLVTSGKNLLNEDAPTVDGVVGPQLPPGDYALSGTLPSGASLRLLNGGADGETITDASSLPHSFTASHPFTPYYAGIGGYATGLQLELGSTATAYEPPNVTATPLPEVELRGLPDGTCDELVIAADGTCEVERNVAEYEVQGNETIGVGEHSNGQKYAMISGIGFSFSSSSSSLLSDRYSCGGYNTVDKYAYVPDANNLVINDSRFTDAGTAKSILASEKPKFVFVTNHTTEPQSPVSLPALPAPTFNVYHDSDVPSDTTATYERDINIAFDKLQAQVSATTVREATNG